MKKVFKFVKGRREDRKDGGITPSSSADLLSPAQTPEDERFLGLDNASGYIVDFCGKDKTLTKLHKAAWQGNIDKLKNALKKIDVDSVDRHNRTPLHFAVAQGHPNIAWFLLGNNARHTICDSEGRTPLLKAVECGHKECLTLLLDRGANVNHADFSGITPLHISAKQGALEVSSLLLERGADVGITNNNGEQPLHIALRAQNKDMVQLLLREGAPVNAVDRENRTPLMLAAKSGNLLLAQLFFEYGAQLFVTDSNGWTAEDYALLGGHQTVASEIKNLMKKETKPVLESHPEEDEAEALKSDADTWNDSNLSNSQEKKTVENKVGQFLRKLSAQSDKDRSEKDEEAVESPGSGVVPPPCQPPRSWQIIEAGMIDEATTDGSEPKRRSITALGSLHSRRESFTENYTDGPKHTLSLNRRRDSKKNSAKDKHRFSFNEEESLKSSLSDEFSILASEEKGEKLAVFNAKELAKKEGSRKSDSGSDWDSNLSSLLESSSGMEKKAGPRLVETEVDGTLGRPDTLNEVGEMWVTHSQPFPDPPPNLLPSKVDEEEGEMSGSWDSGEHFHEGVFPPPPTAFELGVDMAKSISYMKGISIDHAPGSSEESMDWRKAYDQSQSLDCLDEKAPLETEKKTALPTGKQHNRNPSISNQKWRSAELPQQHHPSNRLVANKRINDQLECYDQALRELAESPYAKKQDAIISTLNTKKQPADVDNYYSLPSSKLRDREFSLTGKTKANAREYAMSLPLQFKRAHTKVDPIEGVDGPSSLSVVVGCDLKTSKKDEMENNESLGFDQEPGKGASSKPTSLDFAPPQATDNLESPMSDELTGSDKSDRKSKRHMLLAMRDVKHAVQVTNSFKTSVDDQILSPLTRLEGEFDLSPRKLENAPETLRTSPEEKMFFLGESQGDLGRQETVIERTDFHKSSPSDSGDEPTLWLQDKVEKEAQPGSGPTSDEDIPVRKSAKARRSASSPDSSPLSNGVRGHRTPSAALRRLQRLGSSSDNEESVRERTPKVVIDADNVSPDASLSSGPIDPMHKDSGSEPDSSNRETTPSRNYSLKKHQKWLKERLIAENKERQKLEEMSAQLIEKAERLQYELEDAKEATKSRDEIITLLQAQLTRMETAYTKSLEESVHCRLQLTTLEQEMYHLKELCSQYEEEREGKGSDHNESQSALLSSKIRQLEEERENLCREVVRLEKLKLCKEEKVSGGGGRGGGSGTEGKEAWKERCEVDGQTNPCQSVQNGILPNSSHSSLKRRNSELESQITLANEINRRLEEKLDDIIKYNKMPINENISQSILTLSKKNSDMEKQLETLVSQLNEKNGTRSKDDQALIDRLNDEKVLLIKTYEKRMADVSNEAMESIRAENRALTQTVDQLQNEISRLMTRPNLEETSNRLTNVIVENQKVEVENKEVPDDSEVEVLRRTVASLRAELEHNRAPAKPSNGSLRASRELLQTAGSDSRPVREDELAWSNLYNMKTGARKTRVSPITVPLPDKDSEEFIELKVKELERELVKAKGEIIRQRLETDFRVQNMMPTLTHDTDVVELKKKVVDLENKAINDDSLRLSLQAKTAEMAIGIKERHELEFELNNLKMRMQREFVPKIDAEIAKFQADLLARKMAGSSTSARVVEDGLRERLETLARERQKADMLRRRLGRQCVSWEDGVGIVPSTVIPFRSLPRARLPQPPNLPFF